MSVGSGVSNGANLTCSKKIVHPGIETLPSAFTIGTAVLLKSPLLKLAVVNAEAPPAATAPAAAIDVINVEPINVEVPVALAFTGVLKSEVPVAV